MFKIILILLPIFILATDIPIKIIAIYNNELAFRVDVDNLDIKICLKATPLKNKLPTIKWYINKQIKNKVNMSMILPIKDNKCLITEIYFDDKKLTDILRKKKLIK